ncbi:MULTISPECIES: hypothetical protein [unclassified Janthinobacterium]|uniref:hypothetical protein n=1 Tax=unclassified Janthinobacterium TaxID=2610881 RepID=UPI0018CB93B6|nr:hypothetical protein [Janthinobacterium sp. CG_23.4]MDH6159186.1 hypothetical protein [Janthinobacterium sp. CG_23.4]
MKQTDTIALRGSITDMRQHIAARQAAMHRVQLGVARWRNAPAADTDAPPLPASQTHWHAEAQCHFMRWLELGGFAHAVVGMRADADADTDMHAAAGKLNTPAMAHTPPDTGTSDSSGTSNNSGTGTTTMRPATEAPVPEHCNNCAA